MASSPIPNPGPGGSAAILVAAGKGLRAGPGDRKQFRSLGGVPLLARTAWPFARCREISRLILVVPDPETARARLVSWLPSPSRVDYVGGGATRQESTEAGMGLLEEEEIVLVHDGARPFVDSSLILRVIEAARRDGAAAPLIPVRETLKSVDATGQITGTVKRENFALAQTPQGFRRSVLREALQWARSRGVTGTDEAEIVESSGHAVTRVEGSEENLKLTTPGDFELAERLLGGAREGEGTRVGLGYDVHPLVPGRPLILGGVLIPHALGPAGHSDGDLICHAATDAILGAAGLPDIGQLYPDTEPSLKGAGSLGLLREAGRRIQEKGFRLVNLDLVLVAEEPKLVPHLAAIRENLAQALGCSSDRIGVKGKRGEGLGFEGRREGMAAHAVALLRLEGRKPEIG